MQGGSTVRCPLTPIKMGIFKKGVNKYGEQRDLFYSLMGRVIHSLWELFGSSLKYKHLGLKRWLSSLEH